MHEPLPVRNLNEKRPTSPKGDLLHEGFHGRAATVGSMASFNFGIGRGGEGEITLYEI